MKIDNIYHCCVHKTGSQWIKAILSDETVLKKTGMTLYTYQKHLPTKGDPRKLTERIFEHPFPGNCIVSPLYMDYNSYDSIPKPGSYKTFCIIRDPRDIIVSWYFSVKYSHPLMGKIPRHREILHQLSLSRGLIYCIEYLHDFGLFDSLKSWINIPANDSHIKVFPFEDIVDVNRQFTVISELFSHCHISLDTNETRHLLHKYHFQQLQKKESGKSTNISHYRKGVPGNWKEYFDEDVTKAFEKLAGKLVDELGYKA
jgi:hypothetical protein